MAGKRDIQGRVEGVNDNGVKIDGQWYNYSNFFEGERNPERGAAVSAVIGEFRGKDYLNKLTVIGSALPGGSPAPSAGGGGQSYGGRSPDTDKRIARQVALKAAVDFHSRGDEVAGGVVINTSRMFESYLNEPFGQVAVEDAA